MQPVPSSLAESFVDRIDGPIDDVNFQEEHATLLLAEDAITGLTQAMSGLFLSDAELDAALGVTPFPNEPRPAQTPPTQIKE
jgi:hypothetical protein